MLDHASGIWDVVDGLRQAGAVLDIDNITAHCQAEGVPVTLEDLSQIVSRLPNQMYWYVPRDIAEFIASILEPYSPASILDPWGGMGFLAIPLKQILSPQFYQVYSAVGHDFEVFTRLEEASEFTLYQGNPLRANEEQNPIFDAVVSCPPWKADWRTPITVLIDGEEIEVKDWMAELLILQSCMRLSEKGVGIFIMNTSFLRWSSASRKARYALDRLGFRITAAIELPAGTFSPRTSIPTHIVLLEKRETDVLFTARYSPDSKHKDRLLYNLRERREGKSPSLGRIVQADSFLGFAAVELAERLAEQARRMRLHAYEFTDVVEAVNRLRSTDASDKFDELPNSIYLPVAGRAAICTNQSSLTVRPVNAYQIVLKPHIANAGFVAGLLNSPFGQLWKDLLISKGVQYRIDKSALQTSTFYLPAEESRDLQDTVVGAQRAIAELHAELRDLEQRLWKKPDSVADIEQSLKLINREEHFKDWIDSLPFPLASILWVCFTQGGSENDQKMRLVQFFEALAQFFAVLHLSAFSSHLTLWRDVRERLRATLSGRFSFERATFGLWVKVCERLFAEMRELQKTDERICFELYRTRDRAVLEMLSSKQLIELLQKTNSIRNQKTGHTGAIGGASDREVNEQLRQYVQTVRAIVGASWEAYELFLPGESRYSGGVHQYSARRIMGTTTPFPMEKLVVSEAMEDGFLHLKSPDESRALRLIPLIKIMPSPKTEENACYFFSSRHGDAHRFLSYHYQAESEITRSFEDVSEALSGLVFDVGQQE